MPGAYKYKSDIQKQNTITRNGGKDKYKRDNPCADGQTP